MKHIAGTILQSIGLSQKVKFFVADVNTDDLEFLGELMESGQMRTVIDRQYELGEAFGALRYLGQGHAQGKVIVTV